MRKVTIRPERLRNFGSVADGTVFCLVTNPSYMGSFEIERGGRYADYRVFAYDGEAPFGDFLNAEVPENAHVLVILPNFYFRSPRPEDLRKTRKLGVMACSSTPSSLQAIDHFVRMAERTDPDLQERMADEFFALGEAAGALRFVDPDYGTEAEFSHLSEDLGWHEQIGSLDWGQQQLFPSGEISVLPVQVFGQNIELTLEVNGELAFRGHPVLHSGTPSFLPEDQERIFAKLCTMRDHAVIAKLSGGRISELRPSHPDCAPAAEMLDRMCDVDSRYRTLLEIGFGINTGMALFPGNSAMNEVYGGERGVVHFGLGLIPYTQYHLDIIVPGTLVLDRRGGRVFGPEPEILAAQ